MKWILGSIKTKLTLGIISAVVVLLAVLLIMSYSSLKSYSLNNALELSETILNGLKDSNTFEIIIKDNEEDAKVCG